jgi:hypothetical protein
MELIANQILELAPFFFGVLIMFVVWFGRIIDLVVKPKTTAFVFSVALVGLGLLMGEVATEDSVSLIIQLTTGAVGTYEIFKKFLTT